MVFWGAAVPPPPPPAAARPPPPFPLALSLRAGGARAFCTIADVPVDDAGAFTCIAAPPAPSTRAEAAEAEEDAALGAFPRTSRRGEGSPFPPPCPFPREGDASGDPAAAYAPAAEGGCPTPLARRCGECIPRDAGEPGARARLPAPRPGDEIAALPFPPPPPSIRRTGEGWAEPPPPAAAASAAPPRRPERIPAGVPATLRDATTDAGLTRMSPSLSPHVEPGLKMSSPSRGRGAPPRRGAPRLRGGFPFPAAICDNCEARTAGCVATTVVCVAPTCDGAAWLAGIPREGDAIAAAPPPRPRPCRPPPPPRLEALAGVE